MRRRFIGAAVAAVMVMVAAPVVAPHATAQAGACGPLDVAVVVDTTTSMKAGIQDIKAGIGAVTSAVQSASGGDYRIGLVSFTTTVTVHQPFAMGNKAAVDTAVESLTAFGGGNVPEASDEALNTVVNTLGVRDMQTGSFTPKWRPAARKFAVLVTDALPAGFDDAFTAADEAAAQDRADEAFAAGIEIVPVHMPGIGFDGVKKIMDVYADTTGGDYVAPGFADVAEVIAAEATDCAGRTDVFVRDSGVDSGAEPAQASDPASPHIRLCPMSGVDCPDQTEIQVASKLFFRVKLSNPGPKGSGPAKGTLKLYRTGLGSQALWSWGYDQVGAVAVDVPATGTTAQIPWTPVVGEWVFLVRWVSATDPMTTVETTATAANVKNNNNIAWKALNVNPLPG
jgi:uncharacterized protein YegL